MSDPDVYSRSAVAVALAADLARTVSDEQIFEATTQARALVGADGLAELWPAVALCLLEWVRLTPLVERAAHLPGPSVFVPERLLTGIPTIERLDP